MQIKKVYLTRHLYARLVERTANQLKWVEKEYKFTCYADFLFAFLDKLFESSEIQRIKEREYKVEISIEDAKLYVPVVKVGDLSIYIPTALEKSREEAKEREAIEWLYPLELIPRRPSISLLHKWKKPSLYITREQFLSALFNYASKRSEKVSLKAYPESL